MPKVMMLGDVGTGAPAIMTPAPGRFDPVGAWALMGVGIAGSLTTMPIFRPRASMLEKTSWMALAVGGAWWQGVVQKSFLFPTMMTAIAAIGLTLDAGRGHKRR